MQMCKLWREAECSGATLCSWAERAVPLLCGSEMRNPPLAKWKSKLGRNCASIISKCSFPGVPRTQKDPTQAPHELHPGFVP